MTAEPESSARTRRGPLKPNYEFVRAMPTRDPYARLKSHSAALDASPAMWRMGVEAESESDFVAQALPALATLVSAEYLLVAKGARGAWKRMAFSGAPPSGESLPLELCAETLDRDTTTADERWMASPLGSGSGELLIGYSAAPMDPQLFDAVAGLLAAVSSGVRLRQADLNRIQRLKAILDVAAQWRKTLEVPALLEQMAEAATKLLRSERASIFLWDKSQKTLVGRPALGVENNELRIPDDSGIVGQVVQTGEVRRVDEDPRQQEEIDRSVDEQLNFSTRSLLCAPLRSESGELFGAFEMINKLEGNFTDEDEAALLELAEHAAVALENTQQYEHLVRERNRMADEAAEGVRLIGNCPAVEALRSTVRRVAGTELAVLILGENGAGKEVVAQMIHYLSRRRNDPFVAVNCAALAETLLESELFGHEKGAFTDARESRAGKFELAGDGTLFLDEIGDMSLGGQAKLLRVLEEKLVVRVGGSASIHTNARVIAATNQDLTEMVRERRFREDLYYRLNVVTLDLPPLRERGDDILLLADHFLSDFSAQAHRRTPRLTAAARKKLLQHPWPGNIRELRNLMERIAYLAADEKVDAEELSFILSPNGERASTIPANLTLGEATRQFQIEYIRRRIDQSRGNMTDAAERLGLHRSNLYRKLRQLDMGGEEAE